MIAVDLDATLAEYHGQFPEIGEPIEPMLSKVKKWLADGEDVVIFTARVAPCFEWVNAKGIQHTPEILADQRVRITEWCLKHIGQVLHITATKHPMFTVIYDDRAVQVEPNTGVVLGVEAA